MKLNTKAAIRYAKAVLSLALDKKNANDVNKDMQLIANTINEAKDLQIVLNSPVIKVDIKEKTLLSIFGSSINNVSKGLIHLLIENKRLEILGEVAKQYTIIYDFHKGTQAAIVTTAVALTDDLKDKILIKVKNIVGKKVSIENIIDPSLIGGFILRVGDKQFDASISGEMNDLRRQFDDNLYVPKL
jgi:F-type H+-transporting ATPase subunit delta